MLRGQVHLACVAVLIILGSVSVVSGFAFRAQKPLDVEDEPNQLVPVEGDAAHDEDSLEAIVRQYGNTCNLGNSVRLQGMKFEATKKLFELLVQRNSWLCMSNLDGSQSFFGFEASSKDIEYQKKVFTAVSPYSYQSIFRLQYGRPCVLMKTAKVRQVNNVYVEFLKKIKAPSSSIKALEAHMDSVICNKANSLTNEGRTQLGNQEQTCWDDVYIPLYTTYVLKVMNSQRHIKDHNTIHQLLDITAEMREYTEHTKSMTPAEMQAMSHSFLSNSTAVREAMTPAVFRSQDDVYRACSPICRQLYDYSTVLSHTQFTACCTLCSKSDCTVDSKASAFLDSSTSRSMTKSPPFRLEVHTIKP